MLCLQKKQEEEGGGGGGEVRIDGIKREPQEEDHSAFEPASNIAGKEDSG